jgi:hypothetical protein
MDYPAPCPHDPIEEVAPDIFIVRGSLKMNAIIRLSRNMGIIRHEGTLTLINPIRLTDAGEQQLRALGTVKHIIRLGSFHGIDDPYYVDTFGAQMWCQPGGKTYPTPAPDVTLSEECTLPFPDAEIFCFKKALQPESALLIKRAGGILFTCDAIQHYGDFRYVTFFMRWLMPLMGFTKGTIIGPPWLKGLTPEGGTLRGEFDQLLTLQFDKLLGAHGSFLSSGAHASVAKAIEKAFAD